MKLVKIAVTAIVAVIALSALGVSLVFAQQPNPTDTPWWNNMRNMMQGGGGGMMGGNWESMQQMHDLMSQGGGMGDLHQWMHQSGGVHDLAWTAIADKLGLTLEELNTQIANGKTLVEIANERGTTIQDLASIMETSMETGLAQAVGAGKLSQEQADLMLENMAGKYEWMLTHNGSGMMGSRGGMMGSGSGMMGSGSGGCHNNPAAGDDPSF